MITFLAISTSSSSHNRVNQLLNQTLYTVNPLTVATQFICEGKVAAALTFREVSHLNTAPFMKHLHIKIMHINVILLFFLQQILNWALIQRVFLFFQHMNPDGLYNSARSNQKSLKNPSIWKLKTYFVFKKDICITFSNTVPGNCANKSAL